VPGAVKCCRSTPRCRDCPARKIGEGERRAPGQAGRLAHDELLRALGIPVESPLPPHLRGVPRSLHKYEPLLKRAYAERELAV
jgi:hypothetical protein